MSFYARVDETAMKFKQGVFASVYASDWSWSVTIGDPNVGSLDWKKVSETFKVPKQVTGFNFYLGHGTDGDSTTDANRGTGYVRDILVTKQL